MHQLPGLAVRAGAMKTATQGLEIGRARPTRGHHGRTRPRRSSRTPMRQGGWPELAVKPQKVIPGQTESADRWLACEANMRPVPVVAMEPSGQRGISLL